MAIPQSEFQYVTGPAKTGHICTQFLPDFSNFILLLLQTYLCYSTETFRTYSKIYKEVYKTYRNHLSFIMTKIHNVF